MVAAQRGDAESYSRLLHQLLPVVTRRVRLRLRDDPAADDVVQQVFLSIHRARHTFRGERGFEPWLAAIVRNTVASWGRRRVREFARHSDVDAAELPDRADSEEGGLSAPLARALGQLPATQREAIVLLKLEGLSVAEAARRARVSPGALKLRAHRGYRALRRILEDADA